MHTLRDELRHEAVYQHAWADSETASDPAASGFVGIALVTADNRRAGGHATGEDFVTAARGAVDFLTTVASTFAPAAAGPAPVPEVRAALIATDRTPEEIAPEKIVALSTYLGIDPAKISFVRAQTRRNGEPALHI